MIQDCCMNDLEKKGCTLPDMVFSVAFQVLTHIFLAVNLLCLCTGRGDGFYFNCTEEISSSQPFLRIPCSPSELALCKQYITSLPSVYAVSLETVKKRHCCIFFHHSGGSHHRVIVICVPRLPCGPSIYRQMLHIPDQQLQDTQLLSGNLLLSLAGE